jgi:protein-tyrosine phosphatase
MPSTLLSYDNLPNIRDLGGMPARGGGTIKRGRLIRCGHLGEISDNDLKKLTGLLSVIADFRTTREKTRQPDKAVPDTTYYHIPLVDSLTPGITRETEADVSIVTRLLFKPEEARTYMCRLYSSMATGRTQLAGYSQFLRILKEPHDRAILWHCTVGKDRAGIGAVLIEEALGVPRDEIFADYLYTRECLRDEILNICNTIKKNAAADSPLADEALSYLFGVDEDYLLSFYNTVEKEYGDMAFFFEKKLGITAEDRAALQEMYLD